MRQRVAIETDRINFVVPPSTTLAHLLSPIALEAIKLSSVLKSFQLQNHLTLLAPPFPEALKYSRPLPSKRSLHTWLHDGLAVCAYVVIMNNACPLSSPIPSSFSFLPTPFAG
jgi:hypothetical protein